MTNRRVAILTVAALVAGAGAAVPGSLARAGDYVCTIPRALLCDGCANQVAITLVRGGGCRVSFTPVAPGTPPTGATSFSFHVQTPAVGAAPRVAARPRQAAPAAATRPKCFVFNKNQYCE
jgi:nucleoid-associated protein YgaU